MAPAELALPGARPRPLEGPDMDKGTAARSPQADARDWLADYRPRHLDPGSWGQVRDFVRECVRQLGYDTDGASAWRVIRALARISVWAVEQGLPLDVEVVLDPDTVERFVSVGLAQDVSRATYRAVLRRVGRRLTQRAPWQPKPATASHRQVAAPYSAKEVEQLRADALVQATPGRVRAARGLLALGLGAGLDGRWVARVSAADVTDTGTGLVLVRLGEPSPRIVPVLAEWEAEVMALAGSAGKEFLVGGRSVAKNRAGQLAASVTVGHGLPKFSTSRLRSTWLVTHLTSGTRLPELARAAGMHGVTVLSDLLPNVPAMDDAEAAAMLRGLR